jgi:hypothetical protein
MLKMCTKDKDVQIKRIKLYILSTILFGSLLLNFLFIYVELGPRVVKQYYNRSFKPLEYHSVSDFEEKFKDGTLQMLYDEKSTDNSIIYTRSLTEFVVRNFMLQGYPVFEYGEFGYFCHYLFLYAKNMNDEDLMLRVKNRIDNGLLLDGFKVKRADQCAYGCILIDLYEHYNDKKYSQYYHQIFDYCVNASERNNGLIKYRDISSNQEVDCVGLVAPFLTMYAEHTGDTLAFKMASNLVNSYSKYGVDNTTGLPCQSYCIDTKIKDNRANWGRGAGWYVTGLLGLPEMFLDSLTCQNIIKMDSTLLSLSPMYSQYLGTDDEMCDMSATVMILNYLMQKKLIILSKEDYISLLSPYVSNKGRLKFNTPSIAKPLEGPNAFQEHHVCQALLLYTLSLLE